jgi:DNA polymerase III delta subunit
VNLDRAAGALLAQVFQWNSWGLVTELEKLSLLDGKKITAEIVSGHVNAVSGMNLYSALDSIRSGSDISERLRIFDELLDRNDDPAMLFNMIAVAPYEGKRWKELVADYDVSVKAGKMEYEEALLDIALK